jgi:phosphohistidine phosphatase
LELFILRHGDAGRSISPSSRDSERPLTQVGRERIESVAGSLIESEVEFCKVLTSPLRRARETAEIVAKAMDISELVEKVNYLKPEGNKEELFRVLARIKPDDSVLIVGHSPYLNTLIGDIIAGNPNSHIALKKGGMAKVEVKGFSPRISGELKWLLTPRQLRRME